MGWTEIKGSFPGLRLFLHMVLNMGSLAPKGGRFSQTRAKALNPISSYLVVIFSFLISYALDKKHLRGPWRIVTLTWFIAFSSALYGLPLRANRWTRLWVFTFLGSGNALAQGLNDAWLSANARTPARRSIELALVVMGSNLGGLAGQQMFRTPDALRYPRGFLAISASTLST